jgi:hypothetical protein
MELMELKLRVSEEWQGHAHDLRRIAVMLTKRPTEGAEDHIDRLLELADDISGEAIVYAGTHEHGQVMGVPEPKPIAVAVERAREQLRGHVLLKVFEALPPERQQVLAELADKMVDDVATATQNRVYLRGDPEEDSAATSAIFGNSLCALLRVPPEEY